MPCTQLYSGASVATEAREFIYSLGCMFGSQLTPTTNPYLNFTAGGGLSPFASLQAQVRGWNELLLATSWLTPTQVLSSVSPGSGPIDHSGHDSLMSALLSASSVGGREPPLRSCRFEAVYCRTREDMSTPKYPLRPVRSTDSPSG